MNQQINLYQPMFRKRRRVLSARAILYSVGLTAVGLLSFYGFGEWQTRRLAWQVESLVQQRDVARERLVGLESRLPPRTKSRLLETELARLDRRVKEQSSVIQVLEGDDTGFTRGFSGFLEGFARRRVDGLWLTGFEISDGGHALNIDGQALDAALVPVFVQELSGEPAFGGLSFGDLRVERPVETGSAYAFSLRTRRQETDAHE